MPKNIIICSDGTGNAGIKDRGTNVFKLFEAVDLNGHRTDPSLDAQVALYDDGVGTETFLPLKLLGGAFGFGLAKNVRNLYMGLVRIYDPGDRIFLFGFSRGAFTVRTLAGMIARCGVLDREKLPTTGDLRATVKKAYKTYRRSYRTWLENLFHGEQSRLRLAQADRQAMEDFKTKHSIPEDVHITFLGVWDTVDAVGGPFHSSDVINAVFHRFKFPDRELNPKVEYAAHALSIDDARAAFEPVLWKADPRIEQVWFAGVHSNVGGGYPKQGMSLVTLDWMMQKATLRGLRIWSDDRKYYWEHGSTDDKLYDSRAGLGVFYRWKPRSMQKLWDQQYKQDIDGPPLVHLSALERIAHGTDGYAPGTLAPTVRVVYTPSRDPDKDTADAQDDAADVRAEAVEAALNGIPAERRANLEKVRGTLLIGRIAYYLYVASCLAVILAASVPEYAGSRLNPGIVLKNAGTLLYNAVTGQWTPVFLAAKRLLTDPRLLGTLLAAFAVSGALAYYVDHVRSRTFSRYWHESRQELRKALKAARQKTQATSAGLIGLQNALPGDDDTRFPKRPKIETPVSLSG
jgi:uncharacterized protein (DUF2235 family)